MKFSFEAQVMEVGQVEDCSGMYRCGVTLKSSEPEAVGMFPLTADEARQVGPLLFRKLRVTVTVEVAE